MDPQVAERFGVEYLLLDGRYPFLLRAFIVRRDIAEAWSYARQDLARIAQARLPSLVASYQQYSQVMRAVEEW
jgi:hypothetical protein